MTTNTQTTSQVDEALNETEIGSFIAKNKGIVIGAVIGILVAIVGHGFYKQAEEKTNDTFNQKIYSFKEVFLTPYIDKKIKSDALLSELDKLAGEVGEYEGLNLAFFAISDELVKQSELEAALSVLQKVGIPNDPYSAYFLSTRKASVLEDLNRPAEALAELEGLGEDAKKLLEGKVYLDMGRLQLKTGDKVRARSSFEYLESKMVQDEFSKMAKYYLHQLRKESGDGAGLVVEPSSENK